ncbi:MAG: biotin/lipoyl-binding protein [Planctomycetales bacterium]|nr:biotin/lipoyl-binding protein [Planctomycetales bacterium]
MTSSTDTTGRVTASVGAPNGSPETAQYADNSASDCSAAITKLADQSSCQTDFLRHIADDLTFQFPIDVVVISHPTWDSPMMSISESAPNASTLARRLDAEFVDDLLSNSTSAATACDLPLLARPNALDDHTASGPDDNRTRGLHIQLIDGENTSAVLLVYNPHATPDTVSQIRDLKRLADYARQCRSVVNGLAVHAAPHAPAKPLSGHSTTIPAKRPIADQPNRDQSRVLRHFHNDLDLAGTAYRIANESRRILGIDRVSVLIARRSQFRIESVSGVAVVDRRSNSVTAAEQFSRRVVVLGRPITLPSAEPLPPQIAEPFDHYLDQTDINSVTVIPLYQSQQDDRRRSDSNDIRPLDSTIYTDAPASGADPFAILLLESFADELPTNLTPPMQEVAAEAAIALSNSLEHRRIFGLRFLKTLGDWFGGKRLPYTVISGLAAIGLLAASLIIQVDHQVVATGFAEPAIQQNVFARTDGIVKKIFVHDGQRVTTGDVLMRLENADLETSAESLSGEIMTTSRRLASISSMLLDPATDAKQAARLAIEERQLQSELISRQNQLGLVQRQLSELEIKAPIDGTVAGWQIERKLSDRPVGRGNHLLTIVREDGPWQLRLSIPDKDAAEVIREHSLGGVVKVEFAAASHPESTFAAELDKIATSARRNQDGVNVVDAEAVIVPDSHQSDRHGIMDFVFTDARSGVETTAKITCGRRSVLASWFGDVRDFFNRNVMFYFR